MGAIQFYYLSSRAKLSQMLKSSTIGPMRYYYPLLHSILSSIEKLVTMEYALYLSLALFRYLICNEWLTTEN